MNIGHRSTHHPHPSSIDPSSIVQQQLREDWDNRETVQIISHHIQKITDFLNQFGERQSLDQFQTADLTCRTKLAKLNEQVNTLERRVELLEARVTKGETLN